MYRTTLCCINAEVHPVFICIKVFKMSLVVDRIFHENFFSALTGNLFSFSLSQIHLLEVFKIPELQLFYLDWLWPTLCLYASSFHLNFFPFLLA